MNTDPVETLFVEDDKNFIFAFEQLLASPNNYFHYKVVPAYSLYEAAKLIVNGLKPELILLDLSGVDGKGAATVRQMRSMCSDAVIVVLTGSDDQVVILESMQATADEYLVKLKHDNADILERIRNQVASARGRKQLKDAGIGDATKAAIALIAKCEADPSLPPFKG